MLLSGNQDPHARSIPHFPHLLERLINSLKTPIHPYFTFTLIALSSTPARSHLAMTTTEFLRIEPGYTEDAFVPFNRTPYLIHGERSYKPRHSTLNSSRAAEGIIEPVVYQ